MSYCKYVKKNKLHQHYHDKEYGFPVAEDNLLLERLALEINQAGLSWDLILKKRPGFARAFKNFDIATVANFTDHDVDSLLKDEGIIRNRLKVAAVIHNAQLIQQLQKEHGSFANWLRSIQSIGYLEMKDWVKIFKKTGFKFVGEEILKEFLQSIGHLDIPHDRNCPVYKKIKMLHPKN